VTLLGTTPETDAAISRGHSSLVHLEEAGIESRFESMCLARGFAYATERMEAVRQRVLQRLREAGWADAEEWIG
jgi:hypothetical protein